MSFVILIPSYNPDKALIELMLSLRSQTSEPIIIVNDGSVSGTESFFAQAQEMGAEVLSHPTNRGKGVALKTGLTYIKEHFPTFDGVVTADADGQHLAHDILTVANALKDHPKDLILGTRDLNSKKVPFKSRWGNRITTFVFRLTAHRNVPDTQTGLRGIPESLIDQALAIPGNRYEYEMNMLSEFAKRDTAFIPIPIATVYSDNNQKSHFQPWRDSPRIYIPLLSGFLKMVIVSLLSAALDLGLFTLFQWAFWDTSASGLLYSTVVARVLSGVFNFILNKTWTFRSQGQNVLKAVEYGILFVTQMLLSWILVKLFATLPIHLTFLKALMDFGLFLGSYFVQKTWIFSSKRKTKTAPDIL